MNYHKLLIRKGYAYGRNPQGERIYYKGKQHLDVIIREMNYRGMKQWRVSQITYPTRGGINQFKRKYRDVSQMPVAIKIASRMMRIARD